jgi:hypothetical protein
MNLKGVVTNIAQRTNNWGVCIAGQWINGYGKVPEMFEKGKEVDVEVVEVEKDGKTYYNLKGKEKKEVPKEIVVSTDDRIFWGQCFNKAVDLAIAKMGKSVNGPAFDEWFEKCFELLWALGENKKKEKFG